MYVTLLSVGSTWLKIKLKWELTEILTHFLDTIQLYRLSVMDKPMWLSSISGQFRDLGCGEAGQKYWDGFGVKLENLEVRILMSPLLSCCFIESQKEIKYEQLPEKKDLPFSLWLQSKSLLMTKFSFALSWGWMHKFVIWTLGMHNQNCKLCSQFSRKSSEYCKRTLHVTLANYSEVIVLVRRFE